MIHCGCLTFNIHQQDIVVYCVHLYFTNISQPLIKKEQTGNTSWGFCPARNYAWRSVPSRISGNKLHQSLISFQQTDAGGLWRVTSTTTDFRHRES